MNGYGRTWQLKYGRVAGRGTHTWAPGPVGFGPPLAQMPLEGFLGNARMVGTRDALGVEMAMQQARQQQGGDRGPAGAAAAAAAQEEMRAARRPRPQGPLAMAEPDAGLLPTLTVSLRQSVTRLVNMRWGQLAMALAPPRQGCAWGPLQGECQSVAAWVTASGAIGCMQQVPADVADIGSRLSGLMTAEETRGSGFCVPRASAHSHAACWCPYTADDPVAETDLWRGKLRGGLSGWARVVPDMQEQLPAVDVAWTQAAMDRCVHLAQEAGDDRHTAEIVVACASLFRRGTMQMHCVP